MASSTAISSNGFMLILTLARSTPLPSILTRGLTLKSITRLTATRSFMRSHLPRITQQRRFLHFGDDLPGGVAEVVGGDDRKAAHGEDVLALLRHWCPRGGPPTAPSDATSRAAATMPSAMMSQRMIPPKMLTRMPLTVGSLKMILNAAVTFSFDAPPPTSRKLAGSAAAQLDDVHRRHGEAGAVDHAADVAVELDVGEVVLRRLDLHRVLLGQVAQLGEVLVAEHRRCESKPTLASSTSNLPSSVTASGLISIWLASVPMKAS